MIDYKPCPSCGSYKIDHVFPKDKTLPVFLCRCLRCCNANSKKEWRKKTDYQYYRDLAKQERYKRKATAI